MAFQVGGSEGEGKIRQVEHGLEEGSSLEGDSDSGRLLPQIEISSGHFGATVPHSVPWF